VVLPARNVTNTAAPRLDRAAAVERALTRTPKSLIALPPL